VFNPWLALTLKNIELGLDAQRVIALRMMRLAAGGARGQDEARRMVAEKAVALVEAQATAAVAIMSGHKDHAVAQKVLGVIRKRVRANKRPLSRR
jgi:hypothetical protein